MDLPERTPIRLPDPVYRVVGRCFSITVGTSPRSPVFSDIEFGRECIDLLRTLRDETGTRVYAYCLMPDHAHLLLGAGPAISIPTFLGRWKSLCAKARRARTGDGHFWQRSFYDHAIRENRDILDTALYILQNPVEAGLIFAGIRCAGRWSSRTCESGYVDAFRGIQSVWSSERRGASERREGRSERRRPRPAAEGRDMRRVRRRIPPPLRHVLTRDDRE